MNRLDQAKKVIDYWYLIELFQPNSYPVLPKEKNFKGKKNVRRYKTYAVKLPNRSNDFSHWLKSTSDINFPVMDSELDICYGKIPVHLLFDNLYQALKIDDSEIEVPEGNLCLFAFRVSPEGDYLENTFQVSPFTWAISECIKTQKASMESLSASGLSAYAEGFEGLLKSEDISIKEKIEKVNQRIANELLFYLDEKALNQVNTGDLIFSRYRDQKIYDEQQVNKQYYSDLRQSYVLDDLEYIQNHLTDNDDILSYINCLYEKTEHRINIKENRDQISIWCQPQCFPLGKWPSSFSPSLMQQLAINLGSIKRDEVGNVFSVNGPPGSGKTTLLKEIIVTNIIERAKILTTYENSDDAFTVASFSGNYDEFTKEFYKIDNRLTEYGILVASCNNGAVENITRDLPKSKDVIKKKTLSGLFDITLAEERLEWSEYIDGKSTKKEYPEIYFTHLAQKMVDNAWGLISVPLGKQSNVRNFYFNVLKTLIYLSNDEIDRHKENFEVAKKEFSEQLEKVTFLQDEMQQFVERGRELTVKEASYRNFKALKEHDIAILMTEIEAINKESDDCNQLIFNHQRQLQEFQNLGEQLHQQIAENKNEIISWEDRLKFWEKILSKWYKTEKILTIEELKSKKESLYEMLCNNNARIDSINKELIKQHNIYTELLGKLQLRQSKITEIRNQLQEKAEHLDKLKCAYESDQKQWEKEGVTFLNDTFFDNINQKEYQEKSPFTYDDYNKEREILFYRALVLQREFVLSSKNVFTNFRTISKMWGLLLTKENEPYCFNTVDKAAAYEHLFNSLFLLVPVISTTFAAVQSLLRNVKSQKSLGLLIVDEAGQAAPQMAIGALWRSKRAMIVGDPKQIEPVVTLPKCVYEIAEDNFYQPYKDKTLSVQSFADKINIFSGLLQDRVAGQTIDVWVGCPLRVHRRCIDPMFSISNVISYNDTMINSTEPPDSQTISSFYADKSFWLQSEGKEIGKKNHYVQEQGSEVVKILKHYTSRNITEPNLYIISPFKSVINELTDFLEKIPEFSQNDSWDDWLKTHCGTVHTFQGKEANEVIFILGCDKSAMGAIQWVNSNIVNVAVTRAKYRLYVIGDYEIWKSSELFRILRQCIDK